MDYEIKNSKKYLKELSLTAETYYGVVNRAREYIAHKAIRDNALSVHLMVVAVLWMAGIKEEKLTDEEVYMYLGVQDPPSDDVFMELDDKIKDWGLEEVLEYVWTNMR